MGTEVATVQDRDAITAVKIAKYEREKEVYRKMGINLEHDWHQQAWKETEPIRKALARQEALKTKTVIEVDGSAFAQNLERRKQNAADLRRAWKRFIERQEAKRK